MVKDILISNFEYPLPDDRIAKHPLGQRDACKLLVYSHSSGIQHHIFSSLPSLLPRETLLVCNDTRVINARIKFRKQTGGLIEIFLLEPLEPNDYALMFQSRGSCHWGALVGNLKRWKSGPLSKELEINGKKVTLRAERGGALPGNAHDIHLSWDDPDVTFATIVDAAGYIPIPPYLNRESESSDADDYQTVYARFKGSVAAPTAGLHFTPELFDKLRDNNVATQAVTLHVGAGTFQPVKAEAIGDHPMHTEVFTVKRELIDALINAMQNERPVTAVGTTSVRTLESLPYLGLRLLNGDDINVTQWEAYSSQLPPQKADTIAALRAITGEMDRRGQDFFTAATSIMIAPGFRWRVVDNMITNFHQPQSTLLLLVSSFLGQKEDMEPRTALWRTIYDEALTNDYRFLSYGDACLFSRH